MQHLSPDQQLHRQQLLQELLRLDGRHDPTHPYRSCYTGLAWPITRIMQLEDQLAAQQRVIDRLDADLEEMALRLTTAAEVLSPESLPSRRWLGSRWPALADRLAMASDALAGITRDGPTDG